MTKKMKEEEKKTEPGLSSRNHQQEEGKPEILSVQPPQEQSAGENKSTIDSILSKISKKYEIVIRNTEFLQVHRLRTGIFVLDWATGGGIPRGKVTVLWGDWASSKTTVALRIAANVIRDGGYVFWIDAENSFSSYWAETVGVDIKGNRIYVAQPGSAEAALNLIIEITKTGNVQLIVLDSIAALSPVAEKERYVGEWQQGVMARLLGQFTRKYLSEIACLTSEPPTLILINQLREKIVMFGNPITKPGGKALNYISSLEIRFKEGKPVQEDKVVKFVEFEGVVNKNKFAKPGVEFSYRMCVAEHDVYKPGEVADDAEVLNWMREYGFIIRKDKAYRFIEEAGVSGAFSTLDEISKYFKNKDEYNRLKEAFLDYLLKNNYTL